jgi:hypothetical protein
MSKTPKRPRDPNQLARFVVDLATGEVAEDAAPSEARAKGGRAGGAARAKSLTPEERKLIAQKAAAKRWIDKT